MSTQEKSSSQRYHYQLPTRMNVEDKLINIGPVSLTLRQGFVLTLGGCVAVNIWRGFSVLSSFGGVGQVLRIVLVCLPLLIALIVALARVADRHLEDWAIILIRYTCLPKWYRWQHLPLSLRGEPSRPKQRKKRKGQHGLFDEESEVR